MSTCTPLETNHSSELSAWISPMKDTSLMDCLEPVTLAPPPPCALCGEAIFGYSTGKIDSFRKGFALGYCIYGRRGFPGKPGTVCGLEPESIAF